MVSTISKGRYILIALDFDGTCAGYIPHPHVDPTVIERLGQARYRGAHWVLNSDRSIDDLLQIVSQLPPDLRPWALLSQQRAIHFLGSGGDYHPHRKWNARQAEVHHQLWCSMSPYFSEWSRLIQSNFDVRLGFVNEQSFSFMVLPERIKELGAMLVDLVADWPDAAVSGNHEWRFIHHRSFSKGLVLSEMSRYFCIPASQVLAVGDSINDISMLAPDVAHWVGCPSNACAEVLEVVRQLGGIVARERSAHGTSMVISQFMLTHSVMESAD